MSHITCCYIFQKRKSFRGMSADSADSTRIPQGMGGECKVLELGYGERSAAGVEAGSIKVVEELGEHLSLSSSWILTMVSVTCRPSPTSVEKRVRACSTAGPMIILECSSEHSISSAGRFSPTHGFATFNETLIRVSIPRRAFKLTTGRVSMSLGICCVGITWEDREAASLGGDIGGPRGETNVLETLGRVSFLR